MSMSQGSIGLWATSAVDSFYSSQQSVYINPDHGGGSFAESVFEMDSMTASLLRRGTKKSGRMKKNEARRRDTLTAAIGAPMRTRTLGLSFMKKSDNLEVDNFMKIKGHTRERRSKLNLIGKTKRRKAVDSGRQESRHNARSVALDRALNTCLEAHFELERSKLHSKN